MCAVISISRCIGERDGSKPRINSACYLLRNLCLYDQVQTQRQIAYSSHTMFISLRHVCCPYVGHAVLVAVLCFIIIQVLFQVILCTNLICFEDSSQGICQLGTGVVIHTGITAFMRKCRLCHIGCVSRIQFQDISQCFRNLINQFDVRTVSFCIAVGFDLTNFQVSKLHALDSIVFQSILHSGINFSGSFNLSFCVVIGCLSRGDIIFVDGKRTCLTAIKDIRLVKVIFCSCVVLGICGVRGSLRGCGFRSEYCHRRQGHSSSHSQCSSFHKHFLAHDVLFSFL